MTVADRFTGQVALITGGARGIGAATAARLAAEGADVVIADFDLEAAQETAAAIGGRAVQCDVTSREQVEAAVAEAAAPTGRLDILVTCAGIIRDNLLHKMTDDDWEAVINTHLRGTFLSAQSAQKLMVAQKSGAMVLISSTSALGNRGQANYSAAKAGLQGLTKTLAIELGPFGITANCVAPGFIATADDRADRGADGRAVRGVHGGGRGADARAARRRARRRRRRDRVPLLGRRLVRERPGHLRARRPVTAQRALVTGAASGIGRAIAERLVDDGWQVLAVDLAPDPDGPGEPFAADLATREGNRAAVAAAVERFGGLDALVANAGFQHVSPFDEFDEDRWDALARGAPDEPVPARPLRLAAPAGERGGADPRRRLRARPRRVAVQGGLRGGEARRRRARQVARARGSGARDPGDGALPGLRRARRSSSAR